MIARLIDSIVRTYQQVVGVAGVPNNQTNHIFRQRAIAMAHKVHTAVVRNPHSI